MSSVNGSISMDDVSSQTWQWLQTERNRSGIRPWHPCRTPKSDKIHHTPPYSRNQLRWAAGSHSWSDVSLPGTILEKDSFPRSSKHWTIALHIVCRRFMGFINTEMMLLAKFTSHSKTLIVENDANVQMVQIYFILSVSSLMCYIFSRLQWSIFLVIQLTWKQQ